MTFLRPAVKTERYVAGEWDDISAYVASAVEFDIGMQSSKHEDRLAKIGTFTFLVNNASLVFNPLVDFPKGMQIRITVDAMGLLKIFDCHIKKTDPPTATHGEQFITVHCEDYIGTASEDILREVVVQQNKTANQALDMLLDTRVKQPLAREFDAGTSTFPFVFDIIRKNVSTVYSEFQHIVLSEWGHIYCKTDGTLVFENYEHRDFVEIEDQDVEIRSEVTDTLELIDGDLFELIDGDTLAIRESEVLVFNWTLNYFTEKPEIVTGDNVLNEIIFVIKPRLYDPNPANSEQIYTYNLYLNQPDIPILNGETLTIRGEWWDENSTRPPIKIDAAFNVGFPGVPTGSGPPFSSMTFDPVGTTGVTWDFVAGGDGWKLTVVNNSGVTKNITFMEWGGKSISYQNELSYLVENIASQDEHTIKSLQISQPYQDTLARAKSVTAYLIEAESDERLELRSVTTIANVNEHEMLAFMLAEIGSAFQIEVTRPLISAPFFVQGMRGSIQQNGLISYTLRVRQFRDDLFAARRLRLRQTTTSQRFAVVWSPDLALFVSCGDTGTNLRVSTSPDGITWTERTTPNIPLYAICWSSELDLLVAVGDNGAIATSPDGITWTQRTSPTTNDWRGVAWSPSLGLFAAVSIDGTGNRVITSPDGITWTTRTSAADNQWNAICWSVELAMFVAVASTGSVNRVMTSTNGTTWTSRTTTNRTWYGICWSAEQSKFVATSGDGYSMISTDGITWSETENNHDQTWHTIAYSPSLGIFMTVADQVADYSSRVMYSFDGITWIDIPYSETLGGDVTENRWYGICWSPELDKFVIVGYYSTTSNYRALTF